jgi:hypothetical protein
LRAIATLIAIGAWSLSAQPSPDALVFVVDSEERLDDAATSLRMQVLADAHRRAAGASFVDLTSAAVKPVPDSARDSFFLTLSSEKGRNRDPGVSVSFTEAVEILRRNEAVRDAVIRRECGATPPSSCGGSVHVAAATLVSDVEQASARKLRHCRDAAVSRPGTLLVLVSAGWPYRDERRVNLGSTVENFRRSGSRLLVLRLPTRESYGPLVKDATESLAARLSATFVQLHDERDLTRIREVLASHVPAPNAATLPAVGSDAEPPSRPSTGKGSPSASDPSDEVLRRATDYVDQFERTFAAVIWRERYEQEVRMLRRFNSSGTSFPTLIGRRLLDSELLFVWVPRDASWIAVRDVRAVDGKIRRTSDRPLAGLLKKDTVTIDQLKRLAATNGRFNIGTIVRTFNEPTLALLFLDKQYRHRFTFTRRSDHLIDGTHAATYEFVETARPTVIRDESRDLPVRGSLWIDPSTGHVLQTSLDLTHEIRRLSGRMTVRYGANPKFDVLVPLEMRERYTSATGEDVTAVATYSDFRRFEATVRLK